MRSHKSCESAKSCTMSTLAMFGTHNFLGKLHVTPRLPSNHYITTTTYRQIGKLRCHRDSGADIHCCSVKSVSRASLPCEPRFHRLHCPSFSCTRVRLFSSHGDGQSPVLLPNQQDGARDVEDKRIQHPSSRPGYDLRRVSKGQRRQPKT